MTRFSDYEDYYGDDGYYDSEDIDSNEDLQDEEFEPEFNPDSYEDPDDIIYKDDKQITLRWATLKVGSMTLQISNTGAVQYPDSIFNITYGNPVSGTPYRCVAIRIDKDVYRNYYIHDLVWMAFNGDIPNGWEVGHKERIYDDTQFNHYYKNNLEYLDIYMNIVSREFVM